MKHQVNSAPQEIKVVSINQGELSVNEIMAVSRFFAQVELFAGEKRQKTEEVRKYVEENWLADSSAPQYGFNTGVGILKSVRVSQDKTKEFQRLFIKSHCVGVGDPFDIEIVRGAILLQANALAKGYSGIRPVIIDKLIEMLNKRIHPVVPEQGSLGASGDLAPLAHIASVLVGEAEAEIWLDSQKQKLGDLMDSSGIIRFQSGDQPVEFGTIELHGKEAMSLTNATAVMQSIGVHLLHDVEILLKNADIAAALSLEAMMCEKDAFADELHQLRRQEGQIRTAQNIRALTQNSRRMTAEARLAYFNTATDAQLKQNTQSTEFSDSASVIKKYKLDFEFEKNRIQDAYSLRCVPQVHGACKDAFNYVKSIIERELRAVTDNPVIFPTGNGAYEVKSGGNFHGEPLALALDFLAIALAEIGSISERRVFRLLSPRMSFGLPSNLTGGEAGLNSGYMMVQYTGAQLVSENKILAHPASVDSVPTSDNQEDHVSMGMIAARKARKILQNVQHLIGMETLCSVQGIHLSSRDDSVSLERFPLGEGTFAAFDYLQNDADFVVDLMPGDEYLHKKMIRMTDMSSSAKILNRVEKAITLSI